MVAAEFLSLKPDSDLREKILPDALQLVYSSYSLAEEDSSAMRGDRPTE
jgi:hypothetical protein